MAFLQEKILFSGLLVFCMTLLVSSHSRPYSPPSVVHLTDYFPHVSIDQGFSKSFGGSNIQLISNGSMANLALDKTSGKVLYILWLILIHEIVFLEFALMCIPLCCFKGAGLVSKNKYYYGFFSAAIKLPSGLSSGVVVAFYVSSFIHIQKVTLTLTCNIIHMAAILYMLCA